MKFQIWAHNLHTLGRAGALPGVSIAKFKTREAAEKRARELNIKNRDSFYFVQPL